MPTLRGPRVGSGHRLYLCNDPATMWLQPAATALHEDPAKARGRRLAQSATAQRQLGSRRCGVRADACAPLSNRQVREVPPPGIVISWPGRTSHTALRYTPARGAPGGLESHFYAIHRIADLAPVDTLPRAGRRGVLNPIFGDIFIYITERCRHLTATRVTTAAARDHRQLQSARGSSQNLPL